MTTILYILVGVASLSVLINLFLRRYHLPPIIGYIATGAIVGFFYNLNFETKMHLNEVAEFGIVFLMFTIGLEFSISHLKSMKKEVFVNGLLQVFISALIFSQISYWIFGLSEKASLIIGSALALSSTAIVLKIVGDKGDLSRPYGRYSFGVLLFQDIAVIPILLMITFFTQKGASVEVLLLKTLISGAIAVGLLFLIGKYLMEHILGFVIDAKSHEMFIATILSLVIASSLIAHFFGFSYSLGAFISGMLIAETKYRYQIEADLAPFRDILLGVFFVTVGMQIDIFYLIYNFHIVIALMLAVMALKALIIYLVIRVTSGDMGALKTAITISQVGEFSFAVFELATKEGLIHDEISQPLTLIVVFSMIITPFVLNNIHKITLWLKEDKPEEVADKQTRTIKSAIIRDHVIVCGYGRLGRNVVKRLREQDIPYLAIDFHRKLAEDGYKNGDAVMFGNAAQKSILKSMYIRHATAIIVAINDEHKIRLIAEAVSELTKNVNFIVVLPNRNMVNLLDDLSIAHVVYEDEEVASVLVNHAITCSMDKLYKK